MKEYGTVEENIPPELQNECCVNDAEVSALAKYFKFIDTHYEVPMDIEWAIDNDLPFPQNIFLVQARPVTIKAKEKSAAALLKVVKLKEIIEISLLEGDRAGGKETFDQFEPYFNKKFGSSWKKGIGIGTDILRRQYH